VTTAANSGAATRRTDCMNRMKSGRALGDAILLILGWQRPRSRRL
jgi:hypothetical protein